MDRGEPAPVAGLGQSVHLLIVRGYSSGVGAVPTPDSEHGDTGSTLLAYAEARIHPLQLSLSPFTKNVLLITYFGVSKHSLS